MIDSTTSTESKNFRLPASLKPRRYQATLSLDLERKRFSGTGKIELSNATSAREIVLHGIALELARAELKAGGKTLTPTSIEAKSASETLVLRFADPVPASDATLELDWSGPFTEGLRGLYLAGKIASTQFEAADARRVFPCFDEPAFKCRWAISVRAPKALTVLGNGAIESEKLEGDTKLVTFKETEVMSSYLVALVVGELVGTPAESVAGGVPLRTWASPDKAHLTKFGQDVAKAALPMLQDYFGLPYAFGKVDQVGIPDFEAGAMENSGLITYREVALLLDPATAPLSVQKRVAEVVTHELSHQWFGNWVTMVWWDDLWLNESFATWMAYKIVDKWRPDWRVWLDFDAGTATALALDALQSTHPIRGEVHNAAEASEAFDAITYEKGGAVLRMIENFLGETTFRDGIRRYMKKHARANATADDLWNALARASSQPVVELANAWIRQSGYPMLEAKLSGRTLTLEQRRFYSEPGVTTGETWPVPVVLRFVDSSGQHEQRVLLRGPSSEITLEGSGEIAWVCANAGATGFYRVAYEPGTLERLAKNLSALAPAERVSLIADQWALVRANVKTVDAFLGLAAQFGQEEDDAVLADLVGKLGYVEGRLTEGDVQRRFRAWIERLFGAQLDRLGFEAAAGERDGTRLRRAEIVRALGGIARSGRVVEQARARLQKLLAGDKGAIEPNLLDSFVHVASRAGDAALFDALLARLPSEADPATKRRYLIALGAFEDRALIDRAHSLLFTPTVATQDVAFFVSALLANNAGRDTFWSLLRHRWDDVRARTGNAPMLVRRVVESFAHLRHRQQLDEARGFLEQHPVPEAQQGVRQTLERLAQDVALRERAMPVVEQWLQRVGA